MNAAVAIDPRSCALLIIDMQNDFLERDGYFARRGLDVARLARAIEPTARLRAALPPATRTVYTAQIYEPDGCDDLQRAHRIKPSRLARAAGEPPVIRGSWGSGIVAALAPRAQDSVIPKRRFDAFYQTDLELLLRCWGVKTLLFAGVVADVCVETSLRSAYVRDFDVVLASECVAAWNDADYGHTACAAESHFGLCMSNSEILGALNARR